MDPSSVTRAIIDRVNTIILGKDRQARLSLACLLASGHLLIEDLPGVGKTTLAHVMSKVLGLDYQRVQFTSDLLPADLLGVSIYEQTKASFRFHKGPVFSQVLVADEINRATPKTQSALLEAMEEGQVSIEGETRPLPEPFFVIATQNPVHQVGTFPLPESQLDRFLMRIEMGYPDAQAERDLLAGADRRQMTRELQPEVDTETVLKLQQQVREVHVSEPILRYVQELLDASRRMPDFPLGLSPRAGLALLAAARSWALIEGRTMVVPEDIQAVLDPVVTHRLRAATEMGGQASDHPAELLRRAVPVQ